MSRSVRLWILLGLNIVLVGVLVAVGIGAHSLGVLAEGADYLADAAAIGVSLVAIWLSERPPSATRANGYFKATTWAALVNGVCLLVLTGLVAAGAAERLLTGAREVHGLPVIVVSGVAMAVMLVGVWVLGGDRGDEKARADLNMRALLLDTAADAAAAGGMVVTGAIMLATRGLYWMDPGVALLLSVLIAHQAARLLREVVVALRTGLPVAPP